MDDSHAHFKWLVQARYANQLCLVDLHKLGEDREALKQAGLDGIYQLLVGAAFSLWRAAFLSEQPRSMEDTHKKASKLVCRVLRTNAVAFTQDVELQGWMGGYYLNNAKWRLLKILSQWGNAPPSSPAIDRLRQLGSADFRDASPTDKWDDLQAALDDLTNGVLARLRPTS